MWDTLFNVCCRQYCERPEEVTKVCVDKHGAGHAADSEVCSFGDAVLGRGVRDGFLVCDAVCFTVRLHLPTHEFGGVVYLQRSEFFAVEFLGCCLKLYEQGKGFIPAFHEEQSNKSRVVVNEKYVV